MSQTAAATQEEINKIQQEEHNDFLAEFGGTEPAAPVTDAAPAQPEDEAKNNEGGDGKAKPDESAAQAAPDPGAATAVEDPWKDVSPAIKKAFDDLSTKIGNVEHMTKSSAGRVGALQSALDEARKVTHKQGAASPSDEQVQAAAADSEGWNKLRDQYPEWVSSFEKQMNLVEQRILQKVPKVDADAIRNDAQKGMVTEEVIPIYVKHPTWKKEINSDGFKEFALAGGPSKEEYAEYKQLETSGGAKATERVNEFIRKYPQWWAEKGHAFFEGSVDDSIALLDSYTDFKAAKAAEQDPPADKGRQEKQQRLAAAVAPTKGAHKPKPTVKTEHDEFLEEFNNPT